MNNLPSEMKRNIIEYLSCRDVAKGFSLVGKSFINEKIWKRKFRLYWIMRMASEYQESRGKKIRFPTDLLILMMILTNMTITKKDYSTLSLGVAMRKINSLLLLHIWTKE